MLLPVNLPIISVVTQDVPPLTVVGGVPAKVLKKVTLKERKVQDETID